jgi:acetoin utilization deacetylase AcuC-like enzyme
VIADLGSDLVVLPRREATRAELERVHPADHLDALERVCARGGHFDADTPASDRTWPAALTAAGAGLAAIDALADGHAAGAFLAIRPPGHHARPAQAMGFCLLNNVAVAAAELRARGERVAIVDIDAHHGNGTQEIFYGDPDVLYVSFHEWPLYPGTGPAEDVGSGPGEGFTVNVPVPGGSGDATWCSVVEHALVPLGFDAHEDDPLAGCAVTDAGFAAMAGSARRLAEALGVPLGVVLEGGYDLGALARSLVASLGVLAADAAPAAPAELAVDPHARAALERLRPRWAALA